MALRLAGGRDVFSTAFLFVLLQWQPFILKSIKCASSRVTQPQSAQTKFFWQGQHRNAK